MCHKEDTCVICLENAKFRRLNSSRALAIQKIKNKVNLKEMGEQLKCGHIFHRKCILPWFLNLDSENSYNCPMCRGEIVFSNNMGMRNDFLFERKYDLEYKKAVEEGYLDEDEEDDYEDTEYDGDEHFENETDCSEYDEFYLEHFAESDRIDMEQFNAEVNSMLANGGQPDLRQFLTHEGEIEDDETDDHGADMNVKYYHSRISYQCFQKMCKNALAFLSKPKLEIYSYRPHHSSIAI